MSASPLRLCLAVSLKYRLQLVHLHSSYGTQDDYKIGF